MLFPTNLCVNLLLRLTGGINPRLPSTNLHNIINLTKLFFKTSKHPIKQKTLLQKYCSVNRCWSLYMHTQQNICCRSKIVSGKHRFLLFFFTADSCFHNLVPRVFVPLDQRSGKKSSFCKACAVRNEDLRYENVASTTNVACARKRDNNVLRNNVSTLFQEVFLFQFVSGTKIECFRNNVPLFAQAFRFILK